MVAVRLRVPLLAFNLALCSYLLVAPPQAQAESTPSTEPPHVSEAVDCSSLTQRFGTPFSALATDHFTLLHAGDGQWVNRAGRMLEQIRSAFYQAFQEGGFAPQSSAEKLVWIAFPSHPEYDAYALETDHMDMSSLEGYYSARTNRVALAGWPEPSATGATETCGDAERIRHEAVHQLSFNSGLLKRRVMYPLWASEGLAANFEADAAGPAAPAHENATRLGPLREARAEGALVPLDQFVTLTRVTMEEDPETTLVYAQAWALFNFLFSQRSTELRHYLDALAQLEPGPRDTATLCREFTNAFGDIPQMEPLWSSFIDTLAAPVKVAARRP